MILRVALAALVLLLPMACSDTRHDPQPVMQIAVTAKEGVMLDGRRASMEAVLQAIDEYADQPKTIWLYVEGDGKPEAVADTVTDALLRAHVTVVFSGQRDFSDLE